MNGQILTVSNVRFNHFIFYGQLQQSQPLPHVITTVLKAFYPYNYLAVFLMLVVLPFLLHCIFKHQDQYSHRTIPTTNVCMQHSIHSEISLCIMNFAYIPCPIMFSCCLLNDGFYIFC